MAQPHRSRNLLVLGIVGLALGAGLLLLIDERMVPRSRGMGRFAGALLTGGAVAFVAGLVTWARARIAAAPEGQRNALRYGFLSAAVIVPAIGAFMTYSLGFYWKDTMLLCSNARYVNDLAERKRDLAAGEARLRNPFSWLPELVGFHVSWDCANARADIERIEAGQCPYSLITALPCQCGAERWPEDARCERPQCPALNPPRFRCTGDPW